MTGVEQFKSLCDTFKEVPPPEGPPILEVAGYPHYENVASNILAFFLDPSEAHGYGSLVLDALLSGDPHAPQMSNVRIGREIRTDEGTRIDILIDAEDHLVIVENKIFHWLANPFRDYAAYARTRARGRPFELLVLSLAPAPEPLSDGFRSVVYGDFFARIRENIESSACQGHARYQVLLEDFIRTIENLIKGRSMTDEMFTFFSENTEEVKHLLKAVEAFKAELRKKVTGLAGLIDLKDTKKVKQGLYRERDDLFDTLYHNIMMPDGAVIAIDTVISVHGWRFEVFARTPTDTPRLQRMLDDLAIMGKWKRRFEVGEGFPYNHRLDTVAAFLMSLSTRIEKGTSWGLEPIVSS